MTDRFPWDHTKHPDATLIGLNVNQIGPLVPPLKRSARQVARVDVTASQYAQDRRKGALGGKKIGG